MEKIEEVFEKIKASKDSDVNEILKDIIIIDGAILQNDKLEYKKNTYIALEEKYKEELNKLYYDKLCTIVDVKTKEFVDSMNKEINTKLGNLKIALIRIAGIKLYKDEHIDNLLEKMKNEISTKKLYKLYENIDLELLKHL